MMDRVGTARDRGWTVAEVYKAVDSWRKMHKRQPRSTISFEQYLDMMQEAGLRPSMVGLRRGQYHLARVNDSGGYTPGNCRFIPQEQNQAERKEGYQRKPEFRRLMSDMAKTRERKQCPGCGGWFAPGMFARWHGVKCRKSA